MRTKTDSVTLAPGTARAFPLEAGEKVKITSPEGGQGGDFTFLGFDQALSRNINGWEKFHSVKVTFYADPGMKLYDGDGTPFVEVEEVHSHLRVDMVYPIRNQERDEMLLQYTDEIMCRIAAMMPEEFRGFYANHPRLKELLQDPGLPG